MPEMEGDFVIAIPNFSSHECSVNGHASRYQLKRNAETAEYFEISIFPNGNTPGAEGYVSIALNVPFIVRRDDACFHCTVSVMDIDGELRFPQTLEMDLAGGHRSHSVGLSRFMRRNVLLDANEELLPEDALTLQFDLFCDSVMIHYCDRDPVRTSLSNQSLISSSFALAGVEAFLFDLKNDNSSLCPRLRAVPQYYESVFRKIGVAIDQRMSLYKYDLYTYRNLMLFFKTGNLEHVESLDECVALYYLTHKYGRFDLRKICSEHLNFYLTSENSVEILDVAELCVDAGLRNHAVTHVLLDWKEGRDTAEWRMFRNNCPDSAEAVSRLANDMDVWKPGFEDGLLGLTLKYVLRNWKEVRKYSGWTTKIQRLIVSCFRKDFDCEVLNLQEIEPVEKYKNAEDYDFYR